MAALITIEKTPGEVLNYGFDWTAWLATTGDTIASSSWSVTPSGLTLGAAGNTIYLTSQWISGGTSGDAYTLTNSIITIGNKTAQRSFTVQVVDFKGSKVT